LRNLIILNLRNLKKKQHTRRILIYVVGLLCFLMLASCAHMPEHAKKDVLPIIDAHMHLNRDMPAEQLIELMDRAGVKSMVLMARYYRSRRASGNGSDEQALQYAAHYPGRFIPFIAGQRPILLRRRMWTGPTHWKATSFLKKTKAKAQSGKFHGLGEFIMYHHAYSVYGSQGGGDVDIPVDSSLMHQLAKIGAEHNLPVLIHLEGEPDKLTAMISLLEKEPNTKFIWAHSCGRISAEQTRELLTRFPNLYCDLAGMTRASKRGYGNFWPRYTRWIHPIENGNGRLYPEMKKLYEDFSDRFLIGTDCAHTPALKTYEQRIYRFRVLLSQLTPATAGKLAYQNAEKMFGLK